MNKDIIQGNWTQLKGKALQAWGKLTNDDLDVIDGRQEELVGRLQARYGWAKEEAERRVTEEVARWEKSTTRH
ncbi:MAG: CsbD family protein [Alphaproteobacteria bacterium]|nr:MAG: CsbD family protein [Alphaproteobacteria bacterium]